MPLLTRYLLTEYLKWLLLILAALLTVFLTVDILEKMRRFSESGASLVGIVQYFLFKLPGMTLELSPLALLLATLLTLGALAKNNELIPIMNAGISTVRLHLPMLIIGGIVTIFFILLNNGLIPATKKKARILQQEAMQGGGRGETLFIQNKLWIRLNRTTLLYAQLVDAAKQTMYGVHLYFLGNALPVDQEVYAAELRRENGQWVLFNGARITFQKDGTIHRAPFMRAPIQINKTLREIQQIEMQPEEMSGGKLVSYIHQLQKDGLNATRYQIGLQTKRALPLANFILVLLGIPMAFQYLQKGGIGKGVMIGMVITLVYWLCLSVALSLGRLQVISPIMAGWGPHLLFALTGIILFVRLHRAPV